MADATIHLCDYHAPTSLDKMVIGIEHQKPSLPDEVEQRVKDNWDAFRKTRPTAADNDIAYLVSYDSGRHGITAEVFTAEFRYNQYFNRDDKGMRDTETANTNHFNPLASWIIAVSEDGYVLFGNKKDFGNKKVSGFGGFTSQQDIKKGQIDIKTHIARKLEEEMGDMAKAVEEVSFIGLNFYPLVGPKGFDGIYIAKLGGKAADLEKMFESNAQFSKQLIPTEANPQGLLSFLHSLDWEPTRSCVGGVMTYLATSYGEKELAKALKQYHGSERITNLHPQGP